MIQANPNHLFTRHKHVTNVSRSTHRRASRTCSHSWTQRIGTTRAQPRLQPRIQGCYVQKRGIKSLPTAKGKRGRDIQIILGIWIYIYTHGLLLGLSLMSLVKLGHGKEIFGLSLGLEKTMDCAGLGHLKSDAWMIRG